MDSQGGVTVNLGVGDDTSAENFAKFMHGISSGLFKENVIKCLLNFAEKNNKQQLALDILDNYKNVFDINQVVVQPIIALKRSINE
jgi:hypothetical protein